MGTEPPPILGVLETLLYYTDETAALRFYQEILGFRLIDHQAGRSLFFRAGASVFLVFCSAATRLPGGLPRHGASGSVHTCFRAAAVDYEAWKHHLVSAGVVLLHEQFWSRRGRSFYFHDPSENLLEIANDDIWPL